MESMVGELPENHRLDLQMCSASCFLLSSSTSSTLPPLWKNHPIYSQNFDDSHRLPQAAAAEADRREHMFDKVVTPSDVGKLNRLVIPKQHAEKYFPLDAAAVNSSGGGGKGLVLNFEDRNGRLWRFRYSYWNSSQSYVMTKGWSRFVKDKRLDAGDIVSFHRGTGGFSKNRLYIDWKHRRHHLPSAAAGHSSRSLLPAAPQFYHPYSSGYGFGSGNMVNYKNPEDKMVIESIPVVGAGKKLRLFGVNMECLDASDSEITKEANADTASFQSLQLRLYNGTPVPKTKGKANSNSSLSLDFTM